MLHRFQEIKRLFVERTMGHVQGVAERVKVPPSKSITPAPSVDPPVPHTTGQTTWKPLEIKQPQRDSLAPQEIDNEEKEEKDPFVQTLEALKEGERSSGSVGI